MSQRLYKRNTKSLWALLLVALVFIALLDNLGTLTGSHTLDGILGVVLGLYICSKPAANAVDVLFFDRGALQRMSKQWAGIGWLALNLLVLAVGWIVIVIGTTRLASVIII